MKFKRFAGFGLALVMAISCIGYGNAALAAETADSISRMSEEAAATLSASGEEEKEGINGTEAEEVYTLSNAASGEEEIRPEDISVTWEDSHVYLDLTLGRYHTIRTYGVKGYRDVPFISASDYLDILCEGKDRVSVEDGIMKITMNGTEAVIDPAADTIRIENPARFRSIGGEIDGAILDNNEFDMITASVKNKSTQEKTRPFTVSLKEYHMPVVLYEDTVLMPFLALQNTFGSVCMSTVLAYNGKDYFNAVSAQAFAGEEGHEASKDSPYMKAIFSGPFSKKKKTTKAYAEYGYYSVCLLLDLTFGHKAEKNITTFDEYFTRINAKPSMCSTIPSSAMTAEFLLFNYLFDSGHDSMISATTVFVDSVPSDISDVKEIADDIRQSEEGKELFGQEAPQTEEDKQDVTNAIVGALLEKGLKIPEIAPLIVWGLSLKRVKPKDYGSERLDYADDTAVIYFDAFNYDQHRDPSYYLDPINEEDKAKSTFAFFHECFEDIKKHEEVKNVVINISDNGGGSAAALIAVLGFLSEDGEVKITDMDMMAENYREECYHVDTNLDGIADDKDGFGGLYDFYIMCSGSAYSCGNALPYFAQKEGLAKIIGTRPGGGDCVLGSFVDAYGRCAFYSGMLKLGTKEGGVFTSNEKATVPDLNMMVSFMDAGQVPWFDPAGIADAVHQYQNGVTEIRYDDDKRGEQLSELLKRLLERIGKNEE